MCKYIRNIDIALMMSLVIIEVSSFCVWVVMLISTLDQPRSNDNEEDAYSINLIYCITNMSLLTISFYIILVFGLHSLYFKVIGRLIFYIVCSFTYPFMIWFLFFGYRILVPSGEDESTNLKLMSFIEIFGIIKTLLYLSTGIITLIERRKLVEEIRISPLNCIDESLTEELYKNIINQCKKPNDSYLLNEYKRLILALDKKNLSKTIFTDSSGSGIVGALTKMSGSINNIHGNEQRNSENSLSKPLLNGTGFDSPHATQLKQ